MSSCLKNKKGFWRKGGWRNKDVRSWRHNAGVRFWSCQYFSFSVFGWWIKGRFIPKEIHFFQKLKKKSSENVDNEKAKKKWLASADWVVETNSTRQEKETIFEIWRKLHCTSGDNVRCIASWLLLTNEKRSAIHELKSPIWCWKGRAIQACTSWACDCCYTFLTSPMQTQNAFSFSFFSTSVPKYRRKYVPSVSRRNAIINQYGVPVPACVHTCGTPKVYPWPLEPLVSMITPMADLRTVGKCCFERDFTRQKSPAALTEGSITVRTFVYLYNWLINNLLTAIFWQGKSQ